MKLLRRIVRYLAPYRGVFLLALAATSIFAALDAYSLALLIPFLQTLFAGGSGGTVGAVGGDGILDRIMGGTMGRFVELGAPPSEAIQGIILFLLVVFLLKNVFDFLRIYLVAWIEQAVTRDLRNEVYDHVVDLDLEFFGRTRVGQIISRLTHDIEQLRTLISRELARILSSGFELFFVIGWMLLISWNLTLTAAIVVPGMGLIWGPVVRRVRRGDRTVLNLAGEVNSHIQETLAGIRLVKGSGAEGHERRRFRALTWSYFKNFVRTERFRALSAPITEMVGALGTVAILWYGTRLVLAEGAVSGEEFLTFVALSMKLYAPLKYLGKLPAIIQPGLVASERVFEFLDAPVEVKDRPGALTFRGVREAIVFDRVSFEYRTGEPVLREVSFRAPAGTVTALVGPSGAGKTTLVDLLARFYDVTGGTVRVDGTDLQDFSIHSLRRKLGVVSQDTVLFHDTVRANLAYALGEVDHPSIEAAARAAHAHEFIQRLPQGYDTLVGERGTQLSGGQRQRIAIARALLRDPPILILDEATSSLDSESERLIQEGLDRLLPGRTVFVIAHRLSTIQRADQILVLSEGRIVQRGTHGSLLAEGGLYQRLHELELREAAPPTDRSGVPA